MVFKSKGIRHTAWCRAGLQQEAQEGKAGKATRQGNLETSQEMFLDHLDSQSKGA